MLSKLISGLRASAPVNHCKKCGDSHTLAYSRLSFFLDEELTELVGKNEHCRLFPSFSFGVRGRHSYIVTIYQKTAPPERKTPAIQGYYYCNQGESLSAPTSLFSSAAASMQARSCGIRSARTLKVALLVAK